VSWQFAHALKDRQIELPIVVMTAAQHARTWADEIGAVGILEKHFGIQFLVDLTRCFCPIDAGNRGSVAGRGAPKEAS
jgi:hypothetical protein